MSFWDYARQTRTKDYFEGCNGKVEVRKQYMKLVKEFHPDRGGDAEMMKVINAQYERLEKRMFDNAQEENKRSHASGNEQRADTRHFDAHLFEAVLNKLMKLPDEALEHLTFEVIGAWVWISGDTKPVKDIIKDAGFKFARKKVAWYWYPEGFEAKGKSHGDLDKIRDMHGSTTLNMHREHRSALPV